MSEILVKEYRGKLLENIHRGEIVVVGKNQQINSKVGDQYKNVYYRSAAKPIQVLPVIMSGAAKKYNISEREIALMAASHSGEEVHIRLLKSILKKLDLSVNDLKCGVHPPFSRKARENLRKNSRPLTAAYNACSGKHAAQLALCKFYGWDLANYYEKDHPVQQLLLKTIAEIADYSVKDIYQGIDGCGVVVFGLPIKNLAYSYYRLVNPIELVSKYQNAAKIISRAMRKYPVLVAGSDRFGTILTQTIKVDILAKSGADGIFCFGVKDKGVAIKIEDGNLKSTYPVVLEILKQYQLIDNQELKKLNRFYNSVIYDHLGNKVGNIRPEFFLVK